MKLQKGECRLLICSSKWNALNHYSAFSPAVSGSEAEREYVSYGWQNMVCSVKLWSPPLLPIRSIL